MQILLSTCPVQSSLSSCMWECWFVWGSSHLRCPSAWGGSGSQFFCTQESNSYLLQCTVRKVQGTQPWLLGAKGDLALTACHSWDTQHVDHWYWRRRSSSTTGPGRITSPTQRCSSCPQHWAHIWHAWELRVEIWKALGSCWHPQVPD